MADYKSEMEAEVNMLPVTGSMKTFKVFESSHQVMVVGTDKHKEEWHILKFDKYTDMEVMGKKLEDIISEEIKTFTKEEYKQYMFQFFQKRNRSERNTITGH